MIFQKNPYTGRKPYSFLFRLFCWLFSGSVEKLLERALLDGIKEGKRRKSEEISRRLDQSAKSGYLPSREEQRSYIVSGVE
jgi:hypothetical protein